MKRDGSGMEQKKYILLDVGGTEIKGSVSDGNGVRMRIRKFPAQAQKSTEKILDNFAKICRELMREADGSVVGVGMAIPGPFDYENGISRMQGLNKYDAIYGIPLEREIKARVPELGSARFLFLHDIEAFALGESWYGNCRDADKILCVCIGTGAGSAFVENGKTVKTGKGVPENGWIYQQPFGDSILDDYLSVRGLEQISLAVTRLQTFPAEHNLLQNPTPYPAKVFQNALNLQPENVRGTEYETFLPSFCIFLHNLTNIFLK